MADIRIGRMVLGVCQTNCYFIYREGSTEDNGGAKRDAIVIDPADQGEKIYAALERNGFQVKAIFLTHGHFDHIWGCDGLLAAANEKEAVDERGADSSAEAGDGTEEGNRTIKVYACEAEREVLTNARKNVSAQMSRPYTLEADVYVRDGDVLDVAGMTCKVIATPGHTEGGCCYYFEEAGLLVSGDTLFQESVGRTDLPTGSMGTLVRSIKEKLLVLPDDTQVYPGHGESTTIGHEKKYNSFL